MYKKVCENKAFCDLVMPYEDNKMLEFNQYQKFKKLSRVIYPDHISFIKKVDGCKNNREKLSVTKIGEHIICRYSLSKVPTFDGTENKHDVCSDEDCMKKFCESLRKYTMKIINIEKKKIIPLTNEQ